MDTEEYHRILTKLADFQDLDTSTVASTRRSLAELNDRRDQLLEIRKKLKRDIRGVERYYLERMAEVRNDVEELREDSSRLRRSKRETNKTLNTIKSSPASNNSMQNQLKREIFKK